MKGREKMDREEFMRELEDMFQDEPDNNKLNVVLDLADAYVEYEYEERKKSEKCNGEKMCVLRQERIQMNFRSRCLFLFLRS